MSESAWRPLFFSRMFVGRGRWFWVVLPHRSGDPVAQGIAPSPEQALAEARRQCGALRQGKPWWAKEHYYKISQKLFSRTPIGTSRWFWVVLLDWCSEPVAQGIAPSPEQALADAQRQCGDVQQVHATTAQAYRRKVRALRRQQAAAKGDAAQALEFAYNCWWDYSDYDGHRYEVIRPHLIIRKTKKRIYVEEREYRPRTPTGEWYDYDQETFVLDRLEWDRCGKAERSYRGWYNRRPYYRDPELFRAECGTMSRPACLEALNLPANATRDEVKAAFRRLSG
jgi:hypothetical protein